MAKVLELIHGILKLINKIACAYFEQTIFVNFEPLGTSGTFGFGMFSRYHRFADLHDPLVCLTLRLSCGARDYDLTEPTGVRPASFNL